MALTGRHLANGRRAKSPIMTEHGATNTENVEFFHETVTLTSAAAATAVNIIPDARVGPSRKVYVMGWVSKVSGATNWATTATITIEDTSAVAFSTITVNAATTNGNVVAGPFSNSNVALNDPMAIGSGGTAAKGLQLKGDANGTGSDLKVTVWGVIKG